MRPCPVEKLQHHHLRQIRRIEENLGVQEILIANLQLAGVTDFVEEVLMQPSGNCGSVSDRSRRRCRRKRGKRPGVDVALFYCAGWQATRNPSDIDRGDWRLEAVEGRHVPSGRRPSGCCYAIELFACQNSKLTFRELQCLDIPRVTCGIIVFFAEDRHHLMPARTHLLQGETQ